MASFFFSPFSVSSLTTLDRMYASDLHTKHTLVDALACLVQLPPRSSAERPPPPPYVHRAAPTLLPQLSSSSSSSPLASVAANGATSAAASDNTDPRLDSDVRPLDLYVSAWLLEPDLSPEVTQATTYLLDTQLPSTSSK